jgi:Ca2+-binding RTX toxin-like protein
MGTFRGHERPSVAALVFALVAFGASMALPSATAARSYKAAVSGVAAHAFDDLSTHRKRQASERAPNVAKRATACFGKPATQVGTPGDDVLDGTGGIDVINGLGGDDQISGFEGRDLLCGGNGQDTIFGDDGQDKLSGGAADDILTGLRGADLLTGGGGEFDALNGGPGDDTIRGGPGLADIVSYFNAGAPGVKADLTKGTASGGDGRDTLKGLEVVQGSSHDDTLIGDERLNFLIGALGNDGIDRLDGRGGEDFAAFFFADRPLDVQLAEGSAKGQGHDTLKHIEGAVGGPLKDAIGGDADPNSLFGGDENDQLVGAGGNDFLSGEAGQDFLGGAGGRDSLAGDAGNDELDGGPGADTAGYENAPGSVAANLNLGGAVGEGTDLFTSIEGLTGSRFADSLKGDDRDNGLRGGDGNDSLSGLGGDDSILGGASGDDLRGGDGHDTLLGEQGSNTFNGGRGRDSCFNLTQAANAPNCETGEGREPDSLPPPGGAVPPPPGAGPVTRALAPGIVPLPLRWGGGTPSDVFCYPGRMIVDSHPTFAAAYRTIPEGIWWTVRLWQYNYAALRWVNPVNGGPNPLYNRWIQGSLYQSASPFQPSIDNTLVFPVNTVDANLTFTIGRPGAYLVEGVFWWDAAQGSRPVRLFHDNPVPFGQTQYCLYR